MSLKGNEKLIIRISLFSLLILHMSCSRNFNNEEELLAYVSDERNGYTQHKSVNGVDFTLTYRPTDLLVFQQMSDSLDFKMLNSLRKKYSKYLYFNLSMSTNNQELLNSVANDRQQFGAMVNQLAFGMNEKVHLFTQKKDTIELMDYVYPRMYGMSNSTTMLLVYARDKNNLKADFLNFSIQDLGFHTGDVNFKIDTDKIISEPQLSYKN